jgi:uncharacterized phage protein gp47/JayE
MANTTSDPTTWGWHADGFRVPTLQNCIDYNVSVFESEAGETLLRDAANPIYLLLTAGADQAHRQYEQIRAMLDGLDPTSATGQALDLLARALGTKRLASARTTVTLQFAGVNGVTIPVGFRASGASGTFIVETTASGTISGGTLQLAARCTVVGPRSADPVSTIVTPIAGLTSVALVADSTTLGRDTESDAELRVRILSQPYAPGTCTLPAIKAALERTPGIESAVVYENVSTVTQTVAGFATSAKSVQAIVYGTAADAVVGRTLLDVVAAGIGTAGDQSYSVTEDGETRTVRWREATAVGIQVRITGLVVSGDLDAAKTAILAAVAASINALAIGTDVFLSRVYFAVTGVAAVTDVTGVEIKKTGGSFAVANVVIDQVEKATCVAAPANIEFV